jgi:ubiquinone/menaquinone biosynthesis C-methylase UbiE
MPKTSPLTWFLIALALPLARAAAEEDPGIQVVSKASLVFLGSDSTGVTDEGVLGARFLLEAIDQDNRTRAREALEIMAPVAARESLGGEYTALAWFCEYLAAPESEREAFLSDALTQAYFQFFADEDWAVFKDYIGRQFQGQRAVGDPESSRERLIFLHNMLVSNSPKREGWEKTSRVVDLLGLEKGQRVADVGCHAGYYTTRIAEAVGAQGRVYAIDQEKENLAFLDAFISKAGIDNVETVPGRANDIKLDEEVDTAFIGAGYHLIYVCSTEKERKGFLESVRRALKRGGTLFVLDNAPVAEAQRCYVAKELIVAQLRHYGFEFEEHYEISSYRYLLKFTRK